jgi:hypothetical protein
LVFFGSDRRCIFRLLLKEAQRDASARITHSELLTKAAQLESNGVLNSEDPGA